MSIKEGDMVSIRQDFINRYKNVQESIIKAMDKALERAIGNKVIDFEKCEDNYLDVYPLIGAVLQKEVRRVLGENANSEGSTISENDTICINIKYHKIGEVFNYKVGMSEMTLRVDKCDRCSGCAFENYIYDCVKSGCLGCEREDGESVRYTIVNT